jgi:hypothetical protein
MLLAFFLSTADQRAWDPPPIQSLHIMGRCLGVAADTTKHGIRFNEQVCHLGASNECGGFSCFEAFGFGCLLASHMHLPLKLPLRMETKANGRIRGSESIRYIDDTNSSTCSWGFFSGIEWTRGVHRTAMWLHELEQFTRLMLLFKAVAVERLLPHLQSACFTRS